MKKIFILIVFFFCKFIVISAPVDTLKLLTNNSSKDWYYSIAIANGNTWEEDTVHFCLYQTKIVYKTNGLYDRITPCPNPETGYNLLYTLKGDSIILEKDTLIIKHITNDSLVLYEKGYMKVDGQVVGIIEWDLTLITNKNPTQLNNLNKQDISIFPNPSTNHININGINDIISIDLYNENGQKEKIQVQYSNNNIYIDTSFLCSGTYQCIIQTKENKFSKSFIKL